MKQLINELRREVAELRKEVQAARPGTSGTATPGGRSVQSAEASGQPWLTPRGANQGANMGQTALLDRILMGGRDTPQSPAATQIGHDLGRSAIVQIGHDLVRPANRPMEIDGDEWRQRAEAQENAHWQ